MQVAFDLAHESRLARVEGACPHSLARRWGQPLAFLLYFLHHADGNVQVIGHPLARRGDSAAAYVGLPSVLPNVFEDTPVFRSIVRNVCS